MSLRRHCYPIHLLYEYNEAYLGSHVALPTSTAPTLVPSTSFSLPDIIDHTTKPVSTVDYYYLRHLTLHGFLKSDVFTS